MLKNKKIIFNTALIFVFCAINAIYISLLSIYSGNVFLEIYKWLQIIAIILLVLFAIKNKAASFIAAGVIYGSYLILITYFIFTNSKLDYSFLSRNFKDISAILPQFFPPLILIAAAVIANSVFIHKFEKKIEKKLLYIVPALIIICLPIITKANKLNNEFIYFVKSIYNKDEIINYYQNNIYRSAVEQSKKNKNNYLAQARKINKEILPKYLDNIIILQIESLNSFLVSEKNTPNFLNISKEGTFFPAIYGNSIQTILAQENILCSLPSSFDMNLVESGEDKKILCLPEIFNALDYKTIFLKSYDLNFSGTGEFMKNISFAETHADDIMAEGDIKYLWGYREDIFYNKTFDYLKKNKINKYNFFYIEIGPTNHWPFKTPEEMASEAPYKNPKNHEQRLINTTFIQDQYLKIAWEEINKMFPEKNYTLLILGDHSWPAEMHENNTYNEKESYEENFLTSMIMVIGNEEKYKGKTINSRRSEMDIMPSLLELFNISLEKNKFSSSFIGEVNGEAAAKNNILLIQPYADKYLNIINYPLKYQYNGSKSNMMVYDLANDREEKNGRVVENKDEIMETVKQLTAE